MSGSVASPKGKFEVFEVVSKEQLEQLYKLRYRVFTQEQHKYVGSADHSRGILVDDLDEIAVHLCVAVDGEVVGSMRHVRGRQNATASMSKNLGLDRFAQFSDDAFAFTGRLFVLPQHRGSGVLLSLLQAIYDSGRKAGVVFDFCFCNPHLVRLYEQLGYRRYRTYFHDSGLGFQIPLVLTADDIDHLARVRSPFAPLSKRWPNDPTHAQWFRSTFPEYEHFITPATMSAEDFASLLSTKVNRNDVPLFDGLGETEIEEFLGASTHFKLDPGTHLVRRGDLGEEMYVILEGVAEVRAPSQGEPDGVLLQTLGRGDVFGEMSVISSRPRSADVVSVTPLEVIFIDQVTLRRFMKSKPEMAARLLHNLAKILVERIEMTSARLIQAE